jgi:hypothetical protein
MRERKAVNLIATKEYKGSAGVVSSFLSPASVIKNNPANAQASANHSSCTPTGPCGDERNIENGRVDPLPGDFMSMLRTAPL